MDAVTVTTNDREHLERFLADELLMGSFDRVIVVDNASDDGSPDLARDAGCVVVSRFVISALAVYGFTQTSALWCARMSPPEPCSSSCRVASAS